MTDYVEQTHVRNLSGSRQVYASDLLPRLQSLLAALADIDAAHDKNLETIKNIPADDDRRNEMISTLRRAHSDLRAPYVQELLALRERMDDALR